ncbi:MAG: LPXTG cell wall anchor domain-containing protein [Clostridiales bacterium]|nr:LPXTG cell wall anchor domain-containing protein [Clostridiales bacterium]
MKGLFRSSFAAIAATLLSIIYAIPAAAQTSPQTGDSGIGWTPIIIAGAAVLVIILLLFVGRTKK